MLTTPVTADTASVPRFGQLGLFRTITPPHWVCLYNRSLAPWRDWVCFASTAPRSPRRTTELGFFGALHFPAKSPHIRGLPLPICPSPPKFGFVFPKPIAGAMHHNSFPGNHLPFALPWPKLGLFGAFALLGTLISASVYSGMGVSPMIQIHGQSPPRGGV